LSLAASSSGVRMSSAFTKFAEASAHAALPPMRFVCSTFPVMRFPFRVSGRHHGASQKCGLWWRTRNRHMAWVDRIESGAADVMLATVRGPDGGPSRERDQLRVRALRTYDSARSPVPIRREKETIASARNPDPRAKPGRADSWRISCPHLPVFALARPLYARCMIQCARSVKIAARENRKQNIEAGGYL
jgi:hypothetical protein